jgi:hypothetical protein
MLILLEYQFMFNFIDMYSFIPVSGGVGMGTSALLCPGAYNVIKTALSGEIHIHTFYNTTLKSPEMYMSFLGSIETCSQLGFVQICPAIHLSADERYF